MKSRDWIRGVLLLGLARSGAATLFSAGLMPTSFIYVATNGSDTTGNGSTGQPYRTIGRATDAADQIGDDPAAWAAVFTNRLPTPRTNEYSVGIAGGYYRLRVERVE